eukprot:scaffold26711_cov196-Skeletonema_menzelii.AAC.1
MTTQHSISFADEEVDESIIMSMHGLPLSPKRIQWTHPKDQFDSLSPLDGIRFSPTSFDWDWDADEEALPTAATATDFSKQYSENSPKDMPSLRPS